MKCLWTLKVIGRSGDYGGQDMEATTRRNGTPHRSYSGSEAQNISQDEYIKSLEAKIERLQAGNAKVWTSNHGSPSQLAMSTPSRGTEKERRYERSY